MAEGRRRRAIAKVDDGTLLTILDGYRREAEQARSWRLDRNRANQRAYHGEQDYSQKRDDESQEFLPKTFTAVEMATSLFKRLLVDAGEFFQLELPDPGPGGVPTEALQALLAAKLQTLSYGQKGRTTGFAVVIVDALKMALLESLAIAKVYGTTMTPEPLPGEPDPPALWDVAVRVIPLEDYYPDPTGEGLYEIHEYEMDLHEVLARVESEVYDNVSREDVKQLRGSAPGRASALSQQQARSNMPRAQQAGGDRSRPTIREYWGTLVQEDGEVVAANSITIVANDSTVLRRPTPNPFFHQESPFVVAPLVRVPLTTYHRALMDDAARLNEALNELTNLLIDGATRAVHGVEQLRVDWLEDPRQVSGGIPSGTRLKIKGDVPPGAKVIETVTTGDVPRDGLTIAQLLDQEFQAAIMSTDLRLGRLPSKQVLATEVQEASAGQASIYDGLVRDWEDEFMEPLLRKIWLLMLQHLHEMDSQSIVGVIGEEYARRLGAMTPTERYIRYGRGMKFRVNGLSAVLSRVRDYQKLLALLELATTNPLLAQAMAAEFSWSKILERLFKLLNIDPATLRPSPGEREAQAQAVEGGSPPAAAGGEVGVPPQGLPPSLEALLGPGAGLEGLGAGELEASQAGGVPAGVFVDGALT